MRRFLQTCIFLLMWGLLLGGGYVMYDAHRFLNTPASRTPEEILFSITPGATFDRVAWDLKKAGAIADVFRFRLLGKYHNALGRVRAGEYLISTGWTPEQVLLQITQGQTVSYRLSIREGLTWWETARAVADQGFAKYEDFVQVIHDPEFLREHNIPFSNAEGFLYPETYMLTKPPATLDKQQAREIADIMVRMFWKKTEPIWRELPLRTDAKAAPGQSGLPTSPGAMASPPPANTPPPTAPQAPTQPSLPPATGQEQTSTPGSPVSFVPAPYFTENSVMEPVSAQSAGSVSNLNASPSSSSGRAATALRPETKTDNPGDQSPQSQGATRRGNIYRGSATLDQTPLIGDSPPQLQPSSSATGSSLPDKATAQAAANATQPAAAVPQPAPTPAPAPGGRLTPADIEPAALKRLVILASLVEKETGVPGERKRVAGVYANRLRLNMLLQCDPTIIYGLGRSFTGAIRRSQIDDPKNLYNTYQHPGLPPGPICSSGLAAIQAAFAPERHDYLYFVATGIDAGHTFSKTLNEHNKAVQLYRTRMRDKK